MHKFRSLLVFCALVSGACCGEASAQNRLFGTYYGGEGIEHAGKSATDAAGNVYLTGNTESEVGLVTPDGFDTNLQGISAAFVAKFDPNGKLVWATYYGDGATTSGNDIGLDMFGNVYVLGNTTCPSSDLATPGAYDSSCQGSHEMFLVKFDPQGQRLWGTYIGGPDNEYSAALSVSPPGNVYLIGTTDSPQGIVPALSTDPTFGGVRDAVIAKFSPHGQLRWARYYGGTSSDQGLDIACRAFAIGAGDVCYVTGKTSSASGIATAGAHDPIYAAGNSDAYLARIDGSIGTLVWGTYYGGASRDDGLGVVVDSGLNAYIAGFTFSTNSMASANAFDTSYSNDGKTDLFLAKFTSSGVRVVGTYYGSPQQELFQDLAIDTNGSIYVLGTVEAEGGFATPGAYDPTFNGQYDALFAKFDSMLVRKHATYYGGSGFEMGGGGSGGLAITPSNQIYLYGTTGSSGSIATPGAHKTVPEETESFLVKFAPWL